MKIEIGEYIVKEFNYLIELHQQHGPSTNLQSVEQLVGFILSSIADGSRRLATNEKSLTIFYALVINFCFCFLINSQQQAIFANTDSYLTVNAKPCLSQPLTPELQPRHCHGAMMGLPMGKGLVIVIQRAGFNLALRTGA